MAPAARAHPGQARMYFCNCCQSADLLFLLLRRVNWFPEQCRLPVLGRQNMEGALTPFSVYKSTITILLNICSPEPLRLTTVFPHVPHVHPRPPTLARQKLHTHTTPIGHWKNSNQGPPKQEENPYMPGRLLNCWSEWEKLKPNSFMRSIILRGYLLQWRDGAPPPPITRTN